MQKGCPHIDSVQPKSFNKLIRGKFLGESTEDADDDTSSSNGSLRIFVQNAAKKLVSKSTPTTTDPLRTATTPTQKPSKIQTISLKCDKCDNDQGNSELWLCMHCGKVFCLTANVRASHVLEHMSNGKCSLFLQCQDSHIFCVPCGVYLYPRELSGTSVYEKRLTRSVEHWLQILGRSRLWWRALPGVAAPGCRGLTNFGNTCFFSSTMQALLHTQPLFLALSDQGGEGRKDSEEKQPKKPRKEERPVQRELRRLFEEYWQVGDAPLLTPRPFWRAVQESALYGNYQDKAMEDANSLLLDILSGLEDELVQSLFGVGVLSEVVCKRCEPLLLEGLCLLRQLLPCLEEGLLNLVAAYWIGARGEHTITENSLALAIPEAKTDHNNKNNNNDNGDLSTSSANTPSSSPSSPSSAALVSLCDKLSLGGALRPIGAGESVSLEECLTHYCAQEKVGDFKCENCAERGHSVKRLFLKAFPPVLVIQLKRFKPVQKVMTKCHTKVRVPACLDLSWLSVSSQAARYRLSSMVVHDGGMGGGHYMAYVRGVQQGPAAASAPSSTDLSAAAPAADLSAVGDPAATAPSTDEASASIDETAAAREEGFERERWVWFSDKYFGSIPQRELDELAEPYILFYQRDQ